MKAELKEISQKREGLNGRREKGGRTEWKGDWVWEKGGLGKRERRKKRKIDWVNGKKKKRAEWEIVTKGGLSERKRVLIEWEGGGEERESCERGRMKGRTVKWKLKDQAEWKEVK